MVMLWLKCLIGLIKFMSMKSLQIQKKESILGKTKKLFDKLNGKSQDLKEMVNENPKKALWSMAIPSFFSLLCLSLNCLVDSIFVSECGSASLIGVGFIHLFL